MNLLTFNMVITGEQSGYYIHSVDHKGAKSEFRFHPDNLDLIIEADGLVSEILKRNKSQLLKILKTKNIKTFFPGFNLRFVITDGKDVSIFNDMSKTILLDRRHSEDEICVLENGKVEIHEVFTDASFLEKTGKSGIAAIIKFPDGSYKLYSVEGKAKNNCHAELEAVVAGFEMLKPIGEIRLISDSRYVRKGLTEWMFNWKHNNWQTSSGKQAKNVESWKKLDLLTAGKYIEVAWVKGHSGHFENTMCDLFARDAAEKGLNIGV